MLYVVKFPNGRYLKHDYVLMPSRWRTCGSPWAEKAWKEQLLTHTTNNINEARTFSNEKGANQAVKRGGYSDFDILPVTLTLVTK